MSAPRILIQRLAVLQALGMMRRMAGDERPEEPGRWRTVAAETIMSVDNTV
jgi:DNA-binding HxlR family transcriptional regulator